MACVAKRVARSGAPYRSSPAALRSPDPNSLTRGGLHSVGNFLLAASENEERQACCSSVSAGAETGGSNLGAVISSGSSSGMGRDELGVLLE